MKTPRERIIEKGLEIVGEDEDVSGCDAFCHCSSHPNNDIRKDIRSRIPQLADEVIGIMFDYLQEGNEHEARKFLDGFAHPKDCEKCRITSLTQDNDKLR